jgi:hypothetical protein
MRGRQFQRFSSSYAVKRGISDAFKHFFRFNHGATVQSFVKKAGPRRVEGLLPGNAPISITTCLAVENVSRARNVRTPFKPTINRAQESMILVSAAKPGLIVVL